jgi:protein-S-isoprenylcysteine O-methyltransferase Ste14
VQAVARTELPSSWLVVLQFALIGVLLVTSWPPAAEALLPAALLMLLASAVIGLAALAANRPGNFNIRPEPKPRGQLVTWGVYRRIRHPMYSAVLLAMLAAVLADPRPWRVAAWLALLGVLLAKLRREERYLTARHPEYAAYCKRTRRLIPGIF